jgi:hypothetical protein
MCYKNLIKSSIYEANVLSKLFKIQIPYTFIFCKKDYNLYNENDFKQDINKIILFKKHPRILPYLPKYKI